MTSLRGLKPRGVFRRGAIGSWHKLQNCIEKRTKLRHGQVGHQAFRLLAENLSDFGRKTGQNLSGDLFFLFFTWLWVKNGTKFEWRPFFFALHMILDEKWDEISEWLFQSLIYVPRKFSGFWPPPLFKILRTLLLNPLHPGCPTDCDLKILNVLPKSRQLVFEKNVFTYCFMS